MNNFWQKLPRPFFVLAPMANVTDSVFRKLIAKYGKPDVMWTEFVSADGLISPGRKNLLNDLVYSEKERPIVAQLFTGHPEVMKKAATLVKKLGFDGLDINMGCPDRSVEKQGGGAAMMKDEKVALEVLRAAREGVRSRKKGESWREIPVSVKTRIGYNKVDMDWIRLLLGQKLPALTVHLRTRKEMSDVPAHWELMPEIVKVRDEIQADVKPADRTLVIGNGDVESLEDAAFKAKKYGCDGVMIGRGIFGKPWFFEGIHGLGRRGQSLLSLHKSVKKVDTFKKSPERARKERTPEERLQILLEHTKLFEKTFCSQPVGQISGRHGESGHKRLKNFAVMKKHFKAYVSGWDGAKELRAKLMGTESYKEVKEIIDSI
jgi:tRNA-dihydrouridine synthase